MHNKIYTLVDFKLKHWINAYCVRDTETPKVCLCVCTVAHLLVIHVGQDTSYQLNKKNEKQIREVLLKKKNTKKYIN